MLEGKGMIKETDMEVKMQIHAMSCASQALDLYDVSDCVSVAAHIKKVLLCVLLACLLFHVVIFLSFQLIDTVVGWLVGFSGI